MTVGEILEKGRKEASEDGLHVAQCFPANLTEGHLRPPADFTQGINTIYYASEQIRLRRDVKAGEEGRSAYKDVKVFHTAENIRSGAYDNEEMATCFGTIQQAHEYRRAQVMSNVHDSTLPQSPEEQRKLVHVLFQAFKSVAIAEDNEKYLEAWKNQDHDNRFVEVACWDLLNALILRSRGDGPLQRRFYTGRLKLETYEYQSFAERFDAIVHILARNKTVCKTLLDPPKMLKLVDDPMALKAKTDNNRIVNKSKADTLKKGREIELKESGNNKRKRVESIAADQEEGEVTPQEKKQRRIESTPQTVEEPDVEDPFTQPSYNSFISYDSQPSQSLPGFLPSNPVPMPQPSSFLPYSKPSMMANQHVFTPIVPSSTYQQPPAA